MRCAILGQPAAGKTTILTLLARWCARHGLPVRVLDTSRTLRFCRALGLACGEAQDLEHARRHAALAGAALVAGEDENDLVDLDAALHDVDGIRVDLGVAGDGEHGPEAAIGRFLRSAAAEFHSLALFAHEGGLAPAIASQLDHALIVCEPHAAAVGHAWSAARSLAEHRVPFAVLGNKVSGKYDVHFLLREFGDDLLTCFAASPLVYAVGDRGACALEALEPGNQDVLAVVHRTLRKSIGHAKDGALELAAVPCAGASQSISTLTGQ